jgi:heme exporter protein A
VDPAFERVVTDKLVKTFGATRALAGVSVALESGAVTVVEGPNGSGKSTLLAILAQLARPTRGRVRYGDLDAARHRGALRRHIGILAHASMLYPSLTGRENLAFFAELHGIEDRADRIEELVRRFEIGKFFERPTRTYSRGQLQRVALARAVLHRPKLLLLDEPSTGLDTNAVERLVTAIESEREAGTILVLVTHDPELAQRVADSRIRLDRGRVAEATS